MFGPEYARSCGTAALEPLGVYLPGTQNYPGTLHYKILRHFCTWSAGRVVVLQNLMVRRYCLCHKLSEVIYLGMSDAPDARHSR